MILGTISGGSVVNYVVRGLQLVIWYRSSTPANLAPAHWSDECAFERQRGIRHKWNLMNPSDQSRKGQCQGLLHRGTFPTPNSTMTGMVVNHHRESEDNIDWHRHLRIGWPQEINKVLLQYLDSIMLDTISDRGQNLTKNLHLHPSLCHADGSKPKGTVLPK